MIDVFFCRNFSDIDVFFCILTGCLCESDKCSTKWFILQFFLHFFFPIDIWPASRQEQNNHRTFNWLDGHTDNGHPERAFFQKFETFGLRQTNWAEILGGILAISSQTIGTILALWVPCSWQSVAGSFSYKKRWYLGLKLTTPKYSQNKILAVKNLAKSLRTSVFGGLNQEIPK